ncbi:peptidylprolyl isomerase [Sphingomonas sp.]|uniref:peptidylprolyl isomerase n=1 Tax=Sphingomonas sp. TaxID=28214 RepID=UPI000DB56166|nr:peptidylprolyl isomerase [Sphingomonas sp.]PZU11750.1 MAG: peptidylprolyl isomerase [Sphingomonas sp.]
MRVLVKWIACAVAMMSAGPLLAQATGPSGLAEPKAPPVTSVNAAAPKADPANILNIQLSTGGVVSILLRPDKAPLAVERLKTLAERHFYDGLTFHRVIDGFMAQGGDPKGTGEGGSDLPDIKAEFNDLPHVRGVMAMARASDPDSANSQFYIMLSPNLTLDMKYTIVGRVFQGMAYADGIEKGEPPANPTRMVRVWVGAPPEDPATPPVASAPAPDLAAKLGLPTTLPSKGTPPAKAPARQQ